MDDGERTVHESLVKKTYKKKFSILKHQRAHKNTVRRVRKNRSKVRYYKTLKQLRCNRKTEDLCSAVELFDITDMEWAPSCSSTSLPTEVAEWQKQDQIEYWKSRAISLELENQMLHLHLRNVYAKTIEKYVDDYNKYPELESEEAPQPSKRNQNSENVITKSGKSNEKEPVSPREPSGKNRMEEMEKIYGDKAQKIMGMETALQLNYEKYLTKSKPSHWPIVPLRLKFDE